MKKFAFIKRKDDGSWYIVWKPKQSSLQHRLNKPSYYNLSGIILERSVPLLPQDQNGQEGFFCNNFWDVWDYDTQEELILKHLVDIL